MTMERHFCSAQTKLRNGCREDELYCDHLNTERNVIGCISEMIYGSGSGFYVEYPAPLRDLAETADFSE